jgi:protein SCO1/2
MSRRLLVLAILVLVPVLAWVVFYWQPAPGPQGAGTHRALDLAAPPTGGDFALGSGAGTVGLKDLRGKVVLIYFGYTWCPDICPTNLALIANALKMLAPEELARVQVLFVSVDPPRDTPERLAEYTHYFHPQILGVTGTPDQIAEAARLYGAAYRRVDNNDSAMGYTVDHSAYTYAVDPQGRLAETLDHATPSAKIAAVIRRLLAGAGAEEAKPGR